MTHGVLFVSRDAEFVESRYITFDGVYSVAEGTMDYEPFDKPERFEEYVEAHLLMCEWWELVESPA